jgi:hypothetical protein
MLSWMLCQKKKKSEEETSHATNATMSGLNNHASGIRNLHANNVNSLDVNHTKSAKVLLNQLLAVVDVVEEAQTVEIVITTTIEAIDQVAVAVLNKNQALLPIMTNP